MEYCAEREGLGRCAGWVRRGGRGSVGEGYWEGFVIWVVGREEEGVGGAGWGGAVSARE